uniref:Fibrillar collagen NC1 domain-containing protein n=1 Tax=Laticauda laticaudata TaxID=8630 RepID=A0A8C5S5P7_LATLA
MGPPGAPGARGPQGPSGGDGPPGQRGGVGQPGAVGEKGEPGEAGDPGPPGEPGLQGVKGDVGEKGDSGQSGAAGPPGKKGPLGEDGSKGNMGESGIEGPSGKMGPVGPQGPPGQPGSEGLRGIPGAAVSIFSSWQMVDRGMKENRLQMNAISCCMEKNPNIRLIGLIGPPGEMGEKGDQGLPGNQGTPGTKGDTVSRWRLVEMGLPNQAHNTDTLFPPLKGNTGPHGPPGPPGSPGLLVSISCKILSNWEIEEQGDAPVEGDIDPDADGLAEVLAALSSLHDEVEQMRCPLGTLESPARVCKELQFCHAHLKDGEYWIDPNQGCSRDAFKVYCNFTAGGETCLFPDKKFEAVRLAAWSKEQPGSWFSTFKRGKKFSYVDADGNPVLVTQLTFLRLLSAVARQNFTLLCQNIAAWYEADTSSHMKALRFRAFNDVELMHNSTETPIHALYDGCQGRKGQERTVLQVVTQHVEHLPLIDVAVQDFGDTNQKFGFELGPVCFSG